jgi:hypothetical protein
MASWVERLQKALERKSPLHVRRQRWNDERFAWAVLIFRSAGQLQWSFDPRGNPDLITIRWLRRKP